MMLGIGLSTSQWDYLAWAMFNAALTVQAAYLFVALPWLLVSKRRLRLRAADLPTVAETGWVPFRDPRLLRGSISIVLAVLVQALWVAAQLSTDLVADGSGGWLLVYFFLAVLALGALVFSVTLQMVALSFVRTAWDANEWPQKMSLRERPALTLVRVLRYSPCACIVIYMLASGLRFHLT